MRTKKTTPYLYMLPGCAMVLVFVYIPVIANCVYSFFRLSSYSAGMKFVGLDNYIRFFHNESLGIMLRNNLLYCVISLIVQVGFGTVIALLLESKLASSRFRNAFRNVYYIPALISLTAVGLMFTFIYEPNLGLLNSAFKALGLTSMTQSWLGDSKIAIYCIIAMSQWQYTGYITLLMVVAFQNVSPDYIEAASIDGAGPVRRAISVVLPTLYPLVPELTKDTGVSAQLMYSVIFVSATITGISPLSTTGSMILGGCKSEKVRSRLFYQVIPLPFILLAVMVGLSIVFSAIHI